MTLPERIIFPNERLRPRYLISPFNTEYLHVNNKIYEKGKSHNVDIKGLDQYFKDDKQFSYITNSGREAIEILLKHLGLSANDEVLIINTSGSPYISSCVTQNIESVCKWSRVLGAKTSAVFVIHEFGFPAQIPEEVLKRKMPIIEDCAYSLGSQNENKTIGKIGDYAIYSFSKMFPVQYGGMIRSNKEISERSGIAGEEENYIRILLEHYLEKQPQYIKARKKNYLLYKRLFREHNISPKFKMTKGNIPACFVFNLPYTSLSDKLKSELNAIGIESTVYYGGNGFFVPCHQNLYREDIEYIFRNICRILGLSNKYEK